MDTPHLSGQQAAVIFSAWLSRTSPEDVKAALTAVVASGNEYLIEKAADSIAAVLGWPQAFAVVALAPEQVLRVLEQSASRLDLAKRDSHS